MIIIRRLNLFFSLAIFALQYSQHKKYPLKTRIRQTELRNHTKTVSFCGFSFYHIVYTTIKRTNSVYAIKRNYSHVAISVNGMN